MEAIQEYANITELDAATLNRLIKEIDVYKRQALAAASYPFVDLPVGDTLRCKLFPADKFHKIRYLFDRR